MCSEIDERTRENPESAMLHHNELCQGYMTGMQQNPSALEVALAYDAHQKRMAQQYPGAWPWPKTGCIAPHEEVKITNGFEWLGENGFETKQKNEPQHFDTEAHRAFMRGLG